MHAQKHHPLSILWSPTTLLWFMVALAAFALLLSSMGRTFFGASGLGILTLDAWGSQNLQLLLDPYTTSHIIHGLFFYVFLWGVAHRVPQRYRLLLAIALEMLWELLENSPLIINRYRSATDPSDTRAIASLAP
jgi:hypothetical protein